MKVCCIKVLLQSNVGQCSRNFVQEKSKFQLAKSRLSDIMPLQDLKKVQMNVSERNILHIYNNLQRLEFELSCLAQIYKLNVDIMKTFRVTRCCIEEERSIYITKETVEITVLVPAEENLRLITLDPQVFFLVFWVWFYCLLGPFLWPCLMTLSKLKMSLSLPRHVKL